MDFRQLERSLYKPMSIRCETCGHTAYESWHKLSNVHARGLVKLAEAVRRLLRPVNRYEAGIGRDGSQYGNFAAMRWWGLIESSKADRWMVTELGWDFLKGRRSVPLHVLTFKGEVKGVSIGLVGIGRVADEDTWRKIDYVLNRVPHVEPGALVA